MGDWEVWEAAKENIPKLSYLIEDFPKLIYLLSKFPKNGERVIIFTEFTSTIRVLGTFPKHGFLTFLFRIRFFGIGNKVYNLAGRHPDRLAHPEDR